MDGSRDAALKRFIYIYNLVVFFMLIPHTSRIQGGSRLCVTAVLSRCFLILEENRKDSVQSVKMCPRGDRFQ